MITPPYLHSGDTVAIVAPARKVTRQEIEPAIRKLEEWGLKVLTSQYLYGDFNQYSGTDAERTSDLQIMLDNREVKAVFAARGGYGTIRIIDHLNFSSFCRNPKWIVGFSDITVLHSHIHEQFNIETIHATMPFSFPSDGQDNEAILSLKNTLFGKDLNYEFSTSANSIIGSCTGIITGGNLSILYALSGSVSDIHTAGKILYIEDVDEYLYHVDRMMVNLGRSGKLSGLAGLIVGGMTKMNDNQVPFGLNAEEIIASAVSNYGFPVWFGFPAGHLDDNRALILGRKVTMEVGSISSKIRFDKAS